MLTNTKKENAAPSRSIVKNTFLMCILFFSVISAGAVQAETYSFPNSWQTSAAPTNTQNYADADGNFTLSWASVYAEESTVYHYINNVYSTSYNTGSAKTKNFTLSPGNHKFKVKACYWVDEWWDTILYCQYSKYYIDVAVLQAESEREGPLRFDTSSIQSFLDSARGDGKELVQLVGDEVESRLRAANIKLDKSGLTYTHNIPDQEVRRGCTANVKVRGWRVTGHLSSDSEFDVVLDALSKPIVAKLVLVGYVDASGKVTTRFGMKVLGSCVQYARTTISLGAKFDFDINTSLLIKLNPVKDTSEPGVLKIKITPEVKLAGGIKVANNFNISLTSGGFLKKIPVAGDVVYGIMNPLLEDLTEHFVGKKLDDAAGEANSKFGQYLAQEENRLQNKLRESIPQEYAIPISPQHENEMLSFVSHYALNYLPSSSFIKAHGADLIYYLLVGDEDALKREIATAAACNASADVLSLNLPTTARPSSFKTTSRAEFCGKVDNKSWLGNAEPGISGYSGQEAWTLMPSTRFNLSTVSSIANNYQPYTKRVHYRTVNNITDGLRAEVDYPSYAAAWQACYSAGRGYCSNPPRIEDHSNYVPVPRGSGTCKLEMRIYKKNVSDTGLKPLMAIHGGAWKFRGAAFYGLENQISHFTEKGFVVFAPFYRLAGTSDGNIECNNATGTDIQADIAAALAWVKANKATYGANNDKITLFGQSAGAHLSAWLTVHKSVDIKKALLMYPPTDSEHYLTQYQAFTNGAYYLPDYEGSFEGLGVEALEGYFAKVDSSTNTRVETPLDQIDVNSFDVIVNSFPPIIASSSLTYPPVFMIHGKVDRLVPSIQSVRLCNAYAGNPSSGPATNSGTATKQVYNCGQSKLHILQEANHMLELCLPPLRCEAGKSSAAMTAAQQSLTEGRNWLAQ